MRPFARPPPSPTFSDFVDSTPPGRRLSRRPKGHSHSFPPAPSNVLLRPLPPQDPPKDPQRAALLTTTPHRVAREERPRAHGRPILPPLLLLRRLYPAPRNLPSRTASSVLYPGPLHLRLKGHQALHNPPIHSRVGNNAGRTARPRCKGRGALSLASGRNGRRRGVAGHEGDGLDGSRPQDRCGVVPARQAILSGPLYDVVRPPARRGRLRGAQSH